MRNLKASWKIVALFVLAGIGSVFYVTPTRAFTLVETLNIPAVQLVDGQTAIIAVSNTSPNDLDVAINTIGIGGGVLSTKSATLAPGATTFLVVIAKSKMTFRTAIGLSAQGVAVSDLMVLDKTTGQVTALLLPAVQ
jgi:hypothetical protein